MFNNFIIYVLTFGNTIIILFLFLTSRNDVSTTVTPGSVAKVDYSTAVSPLVLIDVWKPDLRPPEGTTMD
ncbi:hypothetical protein Hanom_Chr13g01231801 [Helianthus anomalus]